MEYKFQYNDEVEKQKILNVNSSKVLVEEQYMLNGTFLVFADEPRPVEVVYTQVPKEELNNLQNQVLEMQSYIVDQEFKNLLNTGGM